jgi:hypothetical protein
MRRPVLRVPPAIQNEPRVQQQQVAQQQVVLDPIVKTTDDRKPAISNSIWGPALWLILHSACERIGAQSMKKLPQEESRIWLGLLQRLRYSLPCPQCKKHYNAFFSGNPISVITRNSVRRWLFYLHNQVNQRLEKPAYSEESLTQYEAIFNFSQHYEIVQEQMLAAVRQGWSTYDDVQQTLRILTEMKCFYDFF